MSEIEKYIEQQNTKYALNIDEFSVGQDIIDKSDNTTATITNKTTSSIEVLIKKKSKEGVDCKQWFEMGKFNKQFK